jgi:hypothetical protein
MAIAIRTIALINFGNPFIKFGSLKWGVFLDQIANYPFNRPHVVM